MSNFSIFCPLGQKNLFGSGRKVPGSEAGQPLIYCGSKVSSGRVSSQNKVNFIHFSNFFSFKRGEYQLFNKKFSSAWTKYYLAKTKLTLLIFLQRQKAPYPCMNFTHVKKYLFHLVHILFSCSSQFCLK